MPDNNTPERRQEAQTALGGEKLAEQKVSIEKRRREAMLAMEGEEHKTRRELDELKAKADTEQTKRRVAERVAAEASKAEAIAKAAAARAAAETATLTAAAEQKERIAKAEANTEQIKQRGVKLSSFRTIKTDMAKVVREQGLSLSKIASMQGERPGNQSTIVGDTGGRGGVIAAFITVLLIASGLSVWWWYGKQPDTVNDVDTAVTPVNLILRADSRLGLELTDFRTLSETYEAVEKLATGLGEDKRVVGITEIYLTQSRQEISLAHFRQALSLNIPDNLTRHLRDNFLFGVYDSGESRSRFIILQTSFFDQAWSAILDWERYMVGDLSTLLRMPNDNRVTWSDRVVRNKDAREAKNELGETVLIYSFIDEQTILIARNENTFVEVYKRLIEQA